MPRGRTLGELGGKKVLQGTDTMPMLLTRRERKGNKNTSARHAVRLLLVVGDRRTAVI